MQETETREWLEGTEEKSSPRQGVIDLPHTKINAFSLALLIYDCLHPLVFVSGSQIVTTPFSA